MKVVRKASDLKFINVGRRLQSKQSHFMSENNKKINRKESLFESEMYPN
jgi:hypothetical protein